MSPVFSSVTAASRCQSHNPLFFALIGQPLFPILQQREQQEEKAKAQRRTGAGEEKEERQGKRQRELRCEC